MNDLDEQSLMGSGPLRQQTHAPHLTRGDRDSNNLGGNPRRQVHALGLRQSSTTITNSNIIPNQYQGDGSFVGVNNNNHQLAMQEPITPIKRAEQHN